MAVTAAGLLGGIATLDDWHAAAPPPGGRGAWRDGTGGKELARLWCASPGALPADLQALLDAAPATAGFRDARARPGAHAVLADGAVVPRHLDLDIRGTAAGGRTVVGVQARAGDPLDRPIGARLISAMAQQRRGKKTRFPELVDAYTGALFGSGTLTAGDLSVLRFDVLAGVVGTLREAASADADQAVFVLHLLRGPAVADARLAEHGAALAFLLSLLGAKAAVAPTMPLLGPFTVPGNETVPAVPLLVGLATTTIR